MTRRSMHDRAEQRTRKQAHRRVVAFVDRVIRLQVQKATTYYMPSQHMTLAEANEATRRLHARARRARRLLIDEIEALNLAAGGWRR
jgi:hypothetical protein